MRKGVRKEKRKMISPSGLRKGKVLLGLCLLLVFLPLSARTIQDEPLFEELLSVDYKDYETTAEYAYVLDSFPGIGKAALTYGKDYVEYTLVKEQEMTFFLTEEGSLYLWDGNVLDVTKPSEDNLLFASYLEELQTLLSEHYEEFHYEVTETYSGESAIDEVPFVWTIVLQTSSELVNLTYSYQFKEGACFVYRGSLPREDLQKAKTVVALAKLPGFVLQ